MIVVRVELWSAITKQRTELARMVIANDATHENPKRGNYKCATYKGRSAEALQKAMINSLEGTTHLGVARVCSIYDWPREARHVWNLVARALKTMKYDEA